MQFIPKYGLFHKMLLLSLIGFKLVDVTYNYVERDRFVYCLSATLQWDENEI